MQTSPMLQPAMQYLTLRSLGTPAVLLSLAMQGVFRGIKDTKTPLYATSNVTTLSRLRIFINIFIIFWGFCNETFFLYIIQW